MKDTMRKALLIVVALVACLAISACAGSTGGSAHKVQVQEDTSIANQQRVLERSEPFPVFTDSAARRVQASEYTADADPNKIWYVTLVGLDGTPYMHLTTRGAPQPASDEITNPSQQTCKGGSNGDSNCDTIGLAEPNGVYQGNADPTFIGILTTGAMARFPCGCIVSDQPFSVSTPVKLSIDETAPISHTDTSVTKGAVVPTGTGHRK